MFRDELLAGTRQGLSIWADLNTRNEPGIMKLRNKFMNTAVPPKTIAKAEAETAVKGYGVQLDFSSGALVNNCRRIQGSWAKNKTGKI